MIFLIIFWSRFNKTLSVTVPFWQIQVHTLTDYIIGCSLVSAVTWTLFNVEYHQSSREKKTLLIVITVELMFLVVVLKCQLKSQHVFHLLLFCKYWVKAPTKEFMVSACWSWTLLKFAINAVISLRCSSIPEKAALNTSLYSWSFSSSRALFLLSFLCVLFSFLLSSATISSSLLALSSSAEVPPELEPAWATWRSVTPLYSQEFGRFLHRKPTVFGFPRSVFCSSPWQPCIEQSSISSSSGTCHLFF